MTKPALPPLPVTEALPALLDALSTGSSGRVEPPNKPRNLPSLKKLGFFPITVTHCACVTGYFPIQNPFVSATACCVSSAERPGSVSGLPIMNVPGGHHTSSSFTPLPKSTACTSPACRASDFTAWTVWDAGACG